MTDTNNWYLQPGKDIDDQFRKAAMERQLSLTKPPGSLGRLEELAVTLSAMQATLSPSAKHIQIAIFAGDHGVANEGVSAFPQVVTMEMVKNFIRGGAAISVMAKELDAGLTVVNAGTISQLPFDSPVIDRPVGSGTANFVTHSAMTEGQCFAALQLGREIVEDYPDTTRIVIGGEMGIANTTSASALAAALGIGSTTDLVGPGTGLDSQGIELKRSVIESALLRIGCGQKGINRHPLNLLKELGGYEIASLVGYFIRAGQLGMTILVDGFISTTAALVACRINPSVREWMLFSHGSAEPGHPLILASLEAEPLLSLGMRLGEGSGSAVAVSLLRSACALQNNMATFAEAGVSDATQ